MNKLKIYLAGSMKNCKSFKEMNEWREQIKKLLEHYGKYYSTKLTVINPVDFYNFESKRHKTEREIMQYDLNHVKSSNIIIVNLKGLNNSIGSCIELYEAYNRYIPVIAFGTDKMFEELHPWIKECITRKENTDEDVVLYIRDFYFTC